MAVLALFLLPKGETLSNARQRACINNLRQLRTMASIYAQQFGGPSKRFATETGKAFWLKLAETTPPLLTGDELEVLMCPDSEGTPRAGFTTYAGPSRDVNTLGGDAVIGYCRHAEHPDGFVFLRKDGSIVILKGEKAKHLMAQVKE